LGKGGMSRCNKKARAFPRYLDLVQTLVEEILVILDDLDANLTKNVRTVDFPPGSP
jgi:hypothetical protein